MGSVRDYGENMYDFLLISCYIRQYSNLEHIGKIQMEKAANSKHFSVMINDRIADCWHNSARQWEYPKVRQLRLQSTIFLMIQKLSMA